VFLISGKGNSAKEKTIWEPTTFPQRIGQGGVAPELQELPEFLPRGRGDFGKSHNFNRASPGVNLKEGLLIMLGVGDGLRNGIKNGINPAMTATITIDAAGRLVLPKAMRDRLHLSAGSQLRAHVVADKIELTPEPDADVRIERRGKRPVIVGGPPFEAVAAIKADREARDETITRRVREK